MWASERKLRWFEIGNQLESCFPEMGHSLKMVPFSSNPKHQWRVEGDKIMNGVGQCLDIRGGKCSNGSELCAYTFKNKENQRWIIQYLWRWRDGWAGELMDDWHLIMVLAFNFICFGFRWGTNREISENYTLKVAFDRIASLGLTSTLIMPVLHYA